MKKPILYVFLNSDLHMSTGKASAQAVHAAILGVIGSSEKRREAWLKSKERTVIVLNGRDQQHLVAASHYLAERGIKSFIVVDEGVNEIEPHTFTALASSILYNDIEDEVAAFKTFSLYRDTIKVNLEFER